MSRMSASACSSLSRRRRSHDRISYPALSFFGESWSRKPASIGRAPYPIALFSGRIANDGLYDFADAFLAMIPPAQRESFAALVKAPPGPSPLDTILTGMAKASPVARWSFANGTWAFGVTGPREFLRKTLDYNLRDGVAEKIRCPTLVCDAERDLFLKARPTSCSTT
jgi:hypothetical protein